MVLETRNSLEPVRNVPENRHSFDGSDRIDVPRVILPQTGKIAISKQKHNLEEGGYARIADGFADSLRHQAGLGP